VFTHSPRVGAVSDVEHPVGKGQEAWHRRRCQAARDKTSFSHKKIVHRGYFYSTIASFLGGVIILVSERGILTHNDTLVNRQQTRGGGGGCVLSTKKLRISS
jgi:hypothetical protein